MNKRTLHVAAALIATLAAGVGLAACGASDVESTSKPAADAPKAVDPDAAFVYLIAAHTDTIKEIATESEAAGEAAGDLKMADAVLHAGRVSNLFGGLVDDLGGKPETSASPLGKTTIAAWGQCEQAYSHSAAAIAALDMPAMKAAVADVNTCTAGMDAITASIGEFTD
jgi:hypothetical protein